MWLIRVQYIYKLQLNFVDLVDMSSGILGCCMLFEVADRLDESPCVMRYYCVVDQGAIYLQITIEFYRSS